MESRTRRATRRLDELLADASRKLHDVRANPDATPAEVAAAGWATYRALGFLEACAILDEEGARLLLPQFESVVQVMQDRLLWPLAELDG